MVQYCVAYGCKNLHDSRIPISFHSFPFKRPKILELWVKAMKRENWNPSKASRLCGAHFLPTDYQNRPGYHYKLLKPDAVPSIFSFSKQLCVRRISRKKLERQQPAEFMEVINNSSAELKYNVHLENLEDEKLLDQSVMGDPGANDLVIVKKEKIEEVEREGETDFTATNRKTWRKNNPSAEDKYNFKNNLEDDKLLNHNISIMGDPGGNDLVIVKKEEIEEVERGGETDFTAMSRKTGRKKICKCVDSSADRNDIDMMDRDLNSDHSPFTIKQLERYLQETPLPQLWAWMVDPKDDSTLLLLQFDSSTRQTKAVLEINSDLSAKLCTNDNMVQILICESIRSIDAFNKLLQNITRTVLCSGRAFSEKRSKHCEGFIRFNDPFLKQQRRPKCMACR